MCTDAHLNSNIKVCAWGTSCVYSRNWSSRQIWQKDRYRGGYSEGGFSHHHHLCTNLKNAGETFNF